MTGQGVNSLQALTEKTTVYCHPFASWAINLLLNLENKTIDSLLVLLFIKRYILILNVVLLGDLIACISCLAMVAMILSMTWMNWFILVQYY